MFVDTATSMSKDFYTIHIGDWMAVVTLALTYLAYRLDKRKEAREAREQRKKEQNERATLAKKEQYDREEMIGAQAVMHAENQRRLDALINFKEEQEAVNRKRDEQINLLAQQTGLLAEAAKGFNSTMQEITRGLNRRLEMLEDRKV